MGSMTAPSLLYAALADDGNSYSNSELAYEKAEKEDIEVTLHHNLIAASFIIVIFVVC